MEILRILDKTAFNTLNEGPILAPGPLLWHPGRANMKARGCSRDGLHLAHRVGTLTLGLDRASLSSRMHAQGRAVVVRQECKTCDL